MLHTLATRSQNLEDFRKLPLSQRQKHEDILHPISNAGYRGQSIPNCDIANCNCHEADGQELGTFFTKLMINMLLVLRAKTKVPIYKAHN